MLRPLNLTPDKTDFSAQRLTLPALRLRPGKPVVKTHIGTQRIHLEVWQALQRSSHLAVVIVAYLRGHMAPPLQSESNTWGGQGLGKTINPAVINELMNLGLEKKSIDALLSTTVPLADPRLAMRHLMFALLKIRMLRGILEELGDPTAVAAVGREVFRSFSSTPSLRGVGDDDETGYLSLSGGEAADLEERQVCLQQASEESAPHSRLPWLNRRALLSPYFLGSITLLGCCCYFLVSSPAPLPVGVAGRDTHNWPALWISAVAPMMLLASAALPNQGMIPRATGVTLDSSKEVDTESKSSRGRLATRLVAELRAQRDPEGWLERLDPYAGRSLSPGEVFLIEIGQVVGPGHVDHYCAFLGKEVVRARPSGCIGNSRQFKRFLQGMIFLLMVLLASLGLHTLAWTKRAMFDEFQAYLDEKDLDSRKMVAQGMIQIFLCVFFQVFIARILHITNKKSTSFDKLDGLFSEAITVPGLGRKLFDGSKTPPTVTWGMAAARLGLRPGLVDLLTAAEGERLGLTLGTTFQLPSIEETLVQLCQASDLADSGSGIGQIFEALREEVMQESNEKIRIPVDGSSVVVEPGPNLILLRDTGRRIQKKMMEILSFDLEAVKFDPSRPRGPPAKTRKRVRLLTLFYVSIGLHVATVLTAQLCNAYQSERPLESFKFAMLLAGFVGAMIPYVAFTGRLAGFGKPEVPRRSCGVDMREEHSRRGHLKAELKSRLERLSEAEKKLSGAETPTLETTNGSDARSGLVLLDYLGSLNAVKSFAEGYCHRCGEVLEVRPEDHEFSLMDLGIRRHDMRAGHCVSSFDHMCPWVVQDISGGRHMREFLRTLSSGGLLGLLFLLDFLNGNRLLPLVPGSWQGAASPLGTPFLSFPPVETGFWLTDLALSVCQFAQLVNVLVSIVGSVSMVGWLKFQLLARGDCSAPVKKSAVGAMLATLLQEARKLEGISCGSA